MVDILKFSEYSKDGWLEGPGRCLVCGHECEIVAPSGKAQFFDCPECGCRKLVLKYPADRGENAEWVCDCGNTLFRIIPEGAYCPLCGKFQGERNDDLF